MIYNIIKIGYYKMIDEDFEIIDTKELCPAEEPENVDTAISIVGSNGREYKVYQNSDGYITNKDGKLYRLRSELASVIWGDVYNKDIILHILRNQGMVLNIGEALEMKLDESKNAYCPENLRLIYKENEWDRTFLRVGLEY